MELETIIVYSGKNGNPIDDTLRILRNEDNYGTFGEKGSHSPIDETL